ncbi:hypothetical protein ACLOJK_017668 [Asimina triloba]
MAWEGDIDDLPKNDANYTALTPLWFLDRAALVHPNRNSLVHGRRRYTWRETYQRCRRFASALNRNSIGPGKTKAETAASLCRMEGLGLAVVDGGVGRMKKSIGRLLSELPWVDRWRMDSDDWMRRKVLEFYAVSLFCDADR